MVGEAGTDSLAGGAGDDQLRTGRVGEGSSANAIYLPVDLAADTLACGEGTGFAELNLWDRAGNCEQRRLERLGRVSGPGVLPVSVRIKSKTFEGPSARIRVRARGEALANLRRRGRGRVELRIGFGPGGDERRVEKRAVTLTLSPRAPSR